jgi:ketosteroid isomerase-like protein
VGSRPGDQLGSAQARFIDPTSADASVSLAAAGLAGSVPGLIYDPRVSSEHPNATAYRRTADAFRSGDGAELASLIAEDVVWHVPGSHSMAGDIHGRTALLAWLDALRAKGFWLVERDVFGSDQHVCALSTMGARREGVEVETGVVSIFVYRDGLQVERWMYPDDAVAWERIFTD